MKQLTEQFVLSRCKCEKLRHIKNLNLWGSELEDVSIVKEMPNLEICSLSLNKIRSLAAFQTSRKLTELYLRKNCIDNLADIKYLQQLPIKVLWLWDNPICSHPNYRTFIIKTLPQLTKLDNTAVTEEERAICSKYSDHELFDSEAAQDAYQENVQSKLTGQSDQNTKSEPHLSRVDQVSAQSQSAQKNISSGASNQSRASSNQPSGNSSSATRQSSANLRSKSPKILPQGGVTNQAAQAAQQQQQQQYSQAQAAQAQQQQVLQQQPQIQQENGSSRNQNILCAVLALLKELDESGLELVKRDIDKKLNKRH